MNWLQAIGVILLLISMGTIAAPIGAVVVMYHNNLYQIVVPPVISDILNGNSTVFQNNNYYNNSSGSSNSGEFVAPVVIGVTLDNISRTLTVTVDFTNTFNFNLTLNDLSGTVDCNQHNYPLAYVSLSNPVFLPSGVTKQIAITGSWTQSGENHVATEHPGATSIDCSLVNATINVNGVTIQQNEPISIGSVPVP